MQNEEITIHTYSERLIMWPAFVNGRLITRKFHGEPLNETETEITIKYANKVITLQKSDIVTDTYEIKTKITLA